MTIFTVSNCRIVLSEILRKKSFLFKNHVSSSLSRVGKNWKVLKLISESFFMFNTN